MNRKFALGILSILAVITSVVFINTAAAAAKGGKDESSAQLVSTTLVLSQVYGGGGGSTGTYFFDYIEIKNISSTPQSLNGLSLYYGSAVGNFASTAGNAFALPNVTLNPGQYYLVQTGPTGSAGAAFPVTPDVITGNLTMSASNGKVALATSALAINTCGATATPCSATQLGFLVDWVAYGAAGNGAAGNGEGGTATNNGTALLSTQGSVRKNGGCTDTDNNNADFDILSPSVPRNTSSTATSCTPTVVTAQHVVDFNGDGRTDYAVVRNVGGGPTGQVRWFINLTGTATTYASDWGIATDFFVPEDYDGDNRTDIAVWRPGAPTVAAFYILNSNGNTVRVEAFGQTGDDPTVVGDYDGDNRADLAVYRGGAAAGNPSTWFYRGSLSNPSGNVTYTPWGQNGDFPIPGDYDGDGRNDFVIQRNNGGGQAAFWTRLATGVFTGVTPFGTPTDRIVPGDYDGDGRTDLAAVRDIGGNFNWFVRSSQTGAISQTVWGLVATDFPTQGDYDGDGRTDLAIWRASATAGQSTFWVLGSTSGASSAPFGANGDYPVANYNTH